MSYRGGERDANTTESLSDVSKSVLQRPEMDRILDILCEHHRRMILLLLKEGIVETQADLMVRGRDEMEMQLVHNHLPKLEDTGYIEWNRETGEISKGPCFEEIEPVLKLIENHADELPAGWP